MHRRATYYRLQLFSGSWGRFTAVVICFAKGFPRNRPRRRSHKSRTHFCASDQFRLPWAGWNGVAELARLRWWPNFAMAYLTESRIPPLDGHGSLLQGEIVQTALCRDISNSLMSEPVEACLALRSIRSRSLLPSGRLPAFVAIALALSAIRSLSEVVCVTRRRGMRTSLYGRSYNSV